MAARTHTHTHTKGTERVWSSDFRQRQLLDHEHTPVINVDRLIERETLLALAAVAFWLAVEYTQTHTHARVVKIVRPVVALRRWFRFVRVAAVRCDGCRQTKL